MKHLDAPGRWLSEKHRRLLMNKYCGRYLRDKHLHHYIIYGETVQDRFEHNRRLRNPSTTAVQQAIHGLSYCVYGKPDVRRLMFEVFDFEQVQPKAVWGGYAPCRFVLNWWPARLPALEGKMQGGQNPSADQIALFRSLSPKPDRGLKQSLPVQPLLDPTALVTSCLAS